VESAFETITVACWYAHIRNDHLEADKPSSISFSFNLKKKKKTNFPQLPLITLDPSVLLV
jgi:hypothetical protein